MRHPVAPTGFAEPDGARELRDADAGNTFDTNGFIQSWVRFFKSTKDYQR
jgi:hypothetical protein